MFCAISGEVPQEPVVSSLTGHVYERRLIEKHIQETGKCPMSGEPMTMENLIAVKTNPLIKPRPPQATSVPSILTMLQLEWDALMLESHQMKTVLERTREELAAALYQNDAAKRVIARLIKERDDAKNAVANYQVGEQVQQEAAMDVDEKTEEAEAKGILAPLGKEISSIGSSLSKNRKKRKVSENLSTVEEIQKFAEAKNVGGIISGKGAAILAMEIKNDQIIVGGSDKSVKVVSVETGETISVLKGHAKKVCAVSIHSDSTAIVSGSEDGKIIVWGATEQGWEQLTTLEHHEAAVTGLSFHPHSRLFVASSKDCSWSFCDIEGNVISHIKTNQSVSCISIHPDGLILATGVENEINIWDVRSMENVATMKEEGKVVGLNFSENGYHMASITEDGTLSLWDLRNVSKISHVSVKGAKSVAFDHSGSYLTTAGESINIFTVKPLKQISELKGHSKASIGARFGPESKSLISAGLDNHLITFQ